MYCVMPRMLQAHGFSQRLGIQQVTMVLDEGPLLLSILSLMPFTSLPQRTRTPLAAFGTTPTKTVRGPTRPSPTPRRTKVTTLPWLWMVTEISTSFTIVIPAVAICDCPAESTEFGKTKRLQVPITSGKTLTSPSIHKVRSTSYHSTPPT